MIEFRAVRSTGSTGPTETSPLLDPHSGHEFQSRVGIRCKEHWLVKGKSSGPVLTACLPVDFGRFPPHWHTNHDDYDYESNRGVDVNGSCK